MPLLDRRRALTAAATAALSLALAACGSDAPSTSSPAAGGTESASTGAFPVTIEHALGATEIEEQPERVVVIGWGSADVLWALGVDPVAVPKGDYGADADGTYPWWEGHYDPAKTELHPSADNGEVPFESIAASRPDLIVAVQSGITPDDYAKLEQIAPTVAYPEAAWKTTWQEQATIVGRAVGKEEEAEALVEQTQDALTAAAEARPELAGKTFTYTYATDGNLGVYLPGDSRVDLLVDMGLAVPPGVAKLAEGATTFYSEVSKERVHDVDSDILVGYADVLPLAQFAADPVYGTIPAVRNGAVVWMEDKTYITATSAPSVLNVPWFLDRYVAELSAAAQDVPA
ncbi:iron complex transport system substrate-binding protein [Kineococcus xinjiangensis]|uniref:Iron complex transport system substrate-binding protein n=1 Tax=Kineococcus xinjiangensis TaxID=512762 RepID=A0A2S6ITY1_9ACTN|nr:iron-siderophore ABC transporter substrate-binding protein [Kineococcus xinjiangensis]PPK97709.1 iron complex transport system substrate-binding protein [Kineococcus xinjiangensis]